MTNAATLTTSPVAAARDAYQGSMLLTANHAASADTWETGLNNNVLVLGSSGAGKTRDHLKPNLLQAQGSYIVLDSKGTLYSEMATYLRKQGYEVDQIDFTNMRGTIGYNPLDHVRRRCSLPVEQDIIAIASALCPREDHESDPFWPLAAANYLSSYIAFVLEALPEQDQTMAEVIRVFDQATTGHAREMFNDLERRNPGSYAVQLHRRAESTCLAERMHASILGIIAANLLPLGFRDIMAAYRHPRRVDFRELGRRRCALFVTIDDMDASLRPLTSLFVRQALTTLVDEADHNTRDGRLAVPVRLMLDDFANLNVANFDNILSVTRSREISCTVVCQTVSQLEARYGKPTANSIIGNCDHQLVLGFQDEETARYFSLRANKPAASLLATPARRWWLFERGCPAICDDAYQIQQHPRYAELAASERALRSETFVDAWLESVVADLDGFEEMTQEDLEIFGDSWEA